MSVTHTPGPWKRGVSETITGADGHRVVDLALCYRSAEMISANAELIAAAPDLLATLEHIERACTKDSDDCDYDRQMFIANVRELATKAIAKARGQS